MNLFVESMLNKAKETLTENGGRALNTSGNACVDFYAVAGALRHEGQITDFARAIDLFEAAYQENPLIATKILFYTRDIREGLGERDIFRMILEYCAHRHPAAIIANIPLIGLYGRYDDMYSLIDTPLEDQMWKVMKEIFEEDLEHMSKNEPVTLLAKWIKTPDASSRNTRKLGILTAQKLGYSVIREFKRDLRALRKYIDITEIHMSANEWGAINYEQVPSRAMTLYRNAFQEHDGDRYTDYINAALAGKAKINSATLYPYDIVGKLLYDYPTASEEKVLEAQWQQLPNYVEDDNILIMADTSGSMEGRPMATSIGLAIYFAERNTGVFHNLFMTFSSKPEFVKLKGSSLRRKVQNALGAHWGMSTNLESAFNQVLNMAITNKIPAEDMPKAIVVISDMEINQWGSPIGNVNQWSFYDEMKRRFASAGYEIPQVVFWNVDSRQDTFHADADRKGVQLVSGQSINTFKTIVKSFNMTAEEAMLEVINSERYANIKLSSY